MEPWQVILSWLVVITMLVGVVLLFSLLYTKYCSNDYKKNHDLSADNQRSPTSYSINNCKFK